MTESVLSGRILSVCASATRGPKKAADSIELLRGHGVAGDIHAGSWHRQLSLLASERIDEQRAAGLSLEPGAYGENIVTEGIDRKDTAIGRRLHVGERAVIQITQHGKHCPKPCQIQIQTGQCIMPADGLFARVIRSGIVKPGDLISTDPQLDRYRFAVLTLSDKGSRGEREDESGPLAVEILRACIDGILVESSMLPDDRQSIERKLADLCDDKICDLIVTTGGTGLSPRDVTPEATQAVCDRLIPGIAEAIRAAGLAYTPRAMLSRAVAGQRGQTIILNLSGSPKAVREQLNIISPVLLHALETATGIVMECARP